MNPAALTREQWETLPLPRIKRDMVDSFVLVHVLVDLGLCKSNSEARRLIEQGGVRLNGAPLRPASFPFEAEAFFGRFLLISRGRKAHGIVEV